MSHRFGFQHEENLVVIAFDGEISPEEEVQAVLDVVGDSRMRPDSKILVDKTNAKMKVTPADVRPHVELIRRHLEKFGKPRVANVVSRDHDYGMTRMLELTSQDELPHEFSVFRDIDEACEWLEIDRSAVLWPES
jgi:hypothetical protein